MHDYAALGSRTAWRRQCGRLHTWVEERASFHLSGTTSYGVALSHWHDGTRTLEVDARRWLFVLYWR